MLVCIHVADWQYLPPVGHRPSFLIFPKPGCWEVSVQVGEHADSRITFVTKVVQIGEGPPLRRLN
jgi:hypothetical protein